MNTSMASLKAFSSVLIGIVLKRTANEEVKYGPMKKYEVYFTNLSLLVEGFFNLNENCHGSLREDEVGFVDKNRTS